jgi:DNA-3-methyladenine glycosylase
MKKLPRKFYTGGTLRMARQLIGRYLVTELKEGKTVGKILETEAYCGVDDPACHAYKGRMTERTKILFSAPGSVYVYLIYGMYYCFNIIAHKRGGVGGVFIRSVEPVDGIKVMLKRYKIKKNNQKDIMKLTNGPGKLCKALGIDKKLYGEDLCGKRIYLLEGEKVSLRNIIAAPRVNIDYAGKGKHYPWRFILVKKGR